MHTLNRLISALLLAILCSCASYDGEEVKDSIKAIENGKNGKAAWRKIRQNFEVSDAGFAIEIKALLFKSIITYPERYAPLVNVSSPEDRRLLEKVLGNGHFAYETYYGTNDLTGWKVKVDEARKVFGWP